MRVSPVVGRANHMIKYKGTTLYPPAMYDVLDNTPYVENYVIEASLSENGTDNITAVVGLRSSAPADVEKDLKDRFRAKIRVAPQVSIQDADHIRRISFPDTSRKPIKFIDKRKKQC